MSADHTPRGPDGGRDGGTDAPSDRNRIERLQGRVDELEAELERERHRRQEMITRYERLLEDRSTETTADEDEEPELWDGDIFTLLLD